MSGQDLPAAWCAPNPALFAAEAVGGRLGAYIRAWAASLDVPPVLLLDEADVVTGPAVVSLLRQLRDGFMTRAVGLAVRIEARRASARLLRSPSGRSAAFGDRLGGAR